ncbi:SDR family NAD(P)-dependent oxidoreductase [Novosphingobium pentaromativorans]|uniref:Short-chain dehydrogenase/reductase SDR n=1 Tax=Novosphingobium pentaromativorans US6-1 TaxID=1088721 RepID=G6EGX0_9SPHN|nr:SDR family NAD(P)-dependent oxidoreductase [Novosphingobium pentaromativorans]AIT82039.1 short-chain dehydrogenase [Novosphingobium pentaromativorans US6-1]EHJ59259.1 short-chain dehydrogenase/reductase SDR [Novosphingobium pentaromativorans US6-1]
MLPLEGKRIAVTGAAGGIGTPVASLLRKAGAHVTGIDRVESDACDASIVTDLSDEIALARLAERLAGDCPDILVNIAGVMRFGLHQSQPIDALSLCYRINLLVPAVLARAVAAPMQGRGSGQIVNIGSVLGAIPYPWFAAYSSSKAGLAALSQGLRRELMGSGVTVTHINPRAARTAFNNGEVNRFLEVTGMKADAPDWVARRIVSAIVEKRETVSFGALERIYAALNAISPRLIDNGLAGQIRKARAEFC